MAEFLIRLYLSQGHMPAYLSRGYGRTSKGFFWVKPHIEGAKRFGDEALQIAHKFPQIPTAVCESRTIGIQTLLASHSPDCIILDDAFQHLQVKRDLNIVMFDANRMPYEDCPLPAGNLREGLGALTRADLIIVNKLTDSLLIPTIERKLRTYLSPTLPIGFCCPKATQLLPFSTNRNPLSMSEVVGKKAVVFSGIGNNAFFQQQVANWGLTLVGRYGFRDHHVYTQRDMEKILSIYPNHSPKSPNFAPPLIITTEKDFFRLREAWEQWGLQQYPFYYLPIRLHWHKEIEWNLPVLINP